MDALLLSELRTLCTNNRERTVDELLFMLNHSGRVIQRGYAVTAKHLLEVLHSLFSGAIAWPVQ